MGLHPDCDHESVSGGLTRRREVRDVAALKRWGVNGMVGMMRRFCLQGLQFLALLLLLPDLVLSHFFPQYKIIL